MTTLNLIFRAERALSRPDAPNPESAQWIGRHVRSLPGVHLVASGVRQKDIQVSVNVDREAASSVELSIVASLRSALGHGNIAVNRIDDLTKRVRFERPLIILSAPRSGSTMLFSVLSGASALWSLREESHSVIEGLAPLTPDAHGFDSNRLTESDAPPEIIDAVKVGFATGMLNHKGRLLATTLLESPSVALPIRLLEKTPKNTLRIPFLERIFPDARYVFLYRDPRAGISSIMEVWRKGAAGYRNLPGWDRPSWSLLLPPGWRELIGKGIAEIAEFQWRIANSYIIADLRSVPRDRWYVLSYDKLLSNFRAEVGKILDFAEIKSEPSWRAGLALPSESFASTEKPSKEKWLRNKGEIEAVIRPSEELFGLIQRMDRPESTLS